LKIKIKIKIKSGFASFTIEELNDENEAE